MRDDRSRGLDLFVAGRRVDGAWDLIRRYCGMPWPGGSPETWGFAYYDAIDTAFADRVDPVDVVSASALQPGLSRNDMAFFSAHMGEGSALGLIGSWLADIPRDASIGAADARVLWRLEQLTGWGESPALALLTKVLHRKRPGLVPLVDRGTMDRYRSVIGHRRANEAWPALLRALRDDLSPAGPNGASVFMLASVQVEVAAATGRWLSQLRLVDIAIWMDAHR